MVLGVAHEHVGDEIGVVELELAEAIRSKEGAEVAIARGVFLVEAGRVDGEEGSVGDAAGECWTSRPVFRGKNSHQRS